MEKFHNSPPVDPVVSIITPEIKKRLGSWVRCSISVLVIGGMATAFAADELSAPISAETALGTMDSNVLANNGTSIEVHYLATGKISLSIDALGIRSNSGLIQVEKPSPTATVRNAFLYTALYSGSLSAGDISIAGTAITPANGLKNVLNGYNYRNDVTTLIKSVVDAAPVGIVDIEIIETQSSRTDGTPLVVVFDDPAQTTDNTIALLYGSQNMKGDTFSIKLAKPIDLSNPDLGLTMSLGISFGYQPGSQISQIDVNGIRVSSAAGGYDDGEAANGALITAGGIGDLPDNPADPYASPIDSRNPDDELYDLLPFVADGDKTIVVNTKNPSNDDNIFFTGIFLSGATATVGENRGKFEFTSKIYFANESSGHAIVKVARKGGNSGEASVNYATAAFEDRDTIDPTSNPASEGEDYATTEGTLTWKNGESGIQTFKVPLFNDNDEEGDETVNLVLRSPTGAALGDKKKISAKLRIADDECHGVYTTAARTLYHPLITVPVFDPISGQATQDVQVFEGTFSLLNGTEDFIIDVTDQEQFNFVKQIKNVDKLKADCYAKYDWQTETFQIPYVDVPSIVVLPMGNSRVGPTQIFRAKMQQMPLSGEYEIGNFIFHVEGAPFQDASITADPNASVKTESKDEVEAKVDASIEIAPDEYTYYQYLYTYDK